MKSFACLELKFLFTFWIRQRLCFKISLHIFNRWKVLLQNSYRSIRSCLSWIHIRGLSIEFSFFWIQEDPPNVWLHGQVRTEVELRWKFRSLISKGFHVSLKLVMLHFMLTGEHSSDHWLKYDNRQLNMELGIGLFFYTHEMGCCSTQMSDMSL